MAKLYKGSLAVEDEKVPKSIVPVVLTASDSSHLQKTIIDIIEEQVRLTPKLVAVEYEGLELSYEDLNQRSNQLGHYLQRLGVRPEMMVGICVERSVEMVVGLLGILKAGGVYVPLDASYPIARVRHMVRDAGVRIVVKGKRTEELAGAEGTRLVCLDGEREEIGRESEENVGIKVWPENLAYVIYTSGSTGKPKGVGVAHGAAAAHLIAIGSEYRYGEMDHVLQSASLSFDVSIEQTLAPLVTGARLVFADHPFRERSEFCALVRKLRITVADLPPAYWGQLIAGDEGPSPELESLRLMIVGGDVMPVEALRRWHAVMNHVELLNAYGPTEGVITATLFRIPVDFFQTENIASVPIGRPVASRRAYVLDDHGEQCPVGVAGELCLGSALLARGYLKHSDMTAAKFVPDPFSAVGGERLYCTGDMAKWREDGTLEFVRRRDRQVKVRGFRIELGEIEAVLDQHPRVRECVVVSREDQLGEQDLVAYITGKEAPPLSSSEMRSYAQNKLPGYMVPSYFTVLEQLPLTVDGKLDRTALPDPASFGLEREQPYVAPRTIMEGKVAHIWGDLLGLDRVGVHDRFFHLGGNSLLATSALGRIRHEHGVELPLRSMFENLTVAEIADLCDSKKYRQREDVPIRLKDRNRPFPLSYSQERVWFLEKLNPGMSAYTFQATLRFEGDLVSSALEKALGVIVGRHEILRTTFHEIDGRPAQVVHDPQPVILPIIHVEDATDPEHEAWEFIQREIRQPFRVDQGPLIYWHLICLRPDSHVLLHREHHYVHDGWSFNIFLRELFQLYRGYTGGPPPALPELPVQFADFASWQRQWIETEEANRQLEYWKQRLAGAPDLLVLPWDRPRPPIPAYRGDELRIDLPEELCILLRKRSREQGVTLFMTTFAAFIVLLHRLSGSTDLCVGSGIADRRWKEIESMLGMVVNNVVLRCDLSSDLTVSKLLQQVREVALGAYANQDVPYDKVVESLRPQRHLSYPPLIQAMFSFHDSALASLDLPGCQVKLMEGVPNGSAKWDLNITLIPRAEQSLGRREAVKNNGITLAWEYSSDLFDEATMKHWMRAYQNLLQGVAAGQQQLINDLPLLSSEEQEFILSQNRQTAPAVLPENALHELFEEQVEQEPEATAIVFEQQSISYGELNRQANRLAHYLRKIGVGPEVRVAMYLERSLEMVVGILGILKAGAAYVPLDLNQPAERLAYVIQDAATPVLLTQQELCKDLPKHIAEVVCLDDSAIFTGEEECNPGSTSAPTNTAYVIYTSGSTGTPKGVEVTHRNVVRLFHATRQWFNFGPADVWTLFHSYAFDFSVWELWGALLHGGRLVIVPYWVSRSPEKFLDLLLEQKVTVLNQTASAFQQLVRAEEAGAKHSNPQAWALRWVIFGGEALEFQSLRPWIARHGVERPKLINMYGITETTVHVTYYAIQDADLEERTVGSRIGQSIPDLQSYVLDAHMQLVPVGMPGDLYVAGEGLARGYLRRPGLTAERFLPDPFSHQPGERIYRSGDLARTRADGTLEYLGRIDRQVKIRGYRIELGEIEAQLMEYAGVEEAVVMAREDVPGETLLVAYYRAATKIGEPKSGQGEGNVGAEQLRAHLAVKLPEYMVPAAYVRLESMPLTANGKLDRKALPSPERNVYAERGYEAPQGEIERALAAIWAEVLNQDQIGRHDSFFKLGGHSLMAMRIVAHTSAIFRVEIPIRLLFEKATISTFGESIRELASSHHVRQNGQIHRIPRQGNLPLSLNQEGRLLVEWWAEMHSAPYAPFHFFMAFSLGPEINIVALKKALNVLASRHEILRTSFSDPKRMSLSQLPHEIMTPLARIKLGEQITPREMRDFVNRLLFGTSIFEQSIQPAVTLNVSRVDLEGFSPESRESELLRIATEAIETPFDYEKPPLVRILLFRKSSAQHLLLIVMPHLLGDAWSMEVFRRELDVLYKAFTLDTSWRLPEIPIQSVDFAAWQRKRLQGAYLEEMASYWKQRWSEFSLLDVQDLPFAKPCPEAPGFMVETIWQTLDRSLATGLRPLLRERNITLHMLWLAALNILLHLYTRKERIGVWGLFANRIQPETENLMGWLANGHIMGVHVDPEQDIDSLLAHVREVVLEAHSHQEIPMGLLWSHFMKDIERDPGAGRSPVQPHISFVTETQTESQLNAFIDEAKFPYRIGRLALKLAVIDHGQDILIMVRYSADRFGGESIDRMIADWQQIVQKIVDASLTKVSEFAAVLQPGDSSDFLLVR
jgi:amino acid adenylation domain-containing protein